MTPSSSIARRLEPLMGQSLSVLSRQCLNRRMASMAETREEVAAWEEERNERGVAIRWRFTTADARIKLWRLYPTIR